MIKVYRLPQLNYVVESEENRKKIREKVVHFLNILPYGAEFSLIMRKKLVNNGLAYEHQIYFCTENELVVQYAEAEDFVSLFRREVSASFEVPSGSDIANVFHKKIGVTYCDRIVCDKWKNTDDRSVRINDDFLRYINGYMTEKDIVVLGFKGLERKEALMFAKRNVTNVGSIGCYRSRLLQFNSLDEVHKLRDNAAALRHAVAAEGEKLYRIRLEVCVMGDSPEMAVNRSKSILDDLCEAYNRVPFYRPAKQNRLTKAADKVGTFVNNMRDKVTTGICDKSIYENFIPFIMAECNEKNGFNYGENQVTKVPIRYDRRHSNLPHAFVFGMSGTGKSCINAAEMAEIIKNTDDDIIAVNDWDDYGTLHSLGMQTIEFGKEKYHINVMDVVAGESERDLVYEFCDKATAIMEELCNRDLNFDERYAVRRATETVMQPFVHKLIEEGRNYDPENNPTFMDVLNKLKEMCKDKSNIALAEAVRSTIEKKKTPENSRLGEKIEAVLKNGIYSYNCQNMLSALDKYGDWLDCLFGHRTDIPDSRAITLVWETSIPTKMQKACYAACINYVWNRIRLNRMNCEKNHIDKRIWAYFDDADFVFNKCDKYVRENLMHLVRRCRPYGGIVTLSAFSFCDVLKTEAGQAVISNVGSFRFLSLAPNCRYELKELYGFSDDMLEYVTDQFAGSGIFYNNRDPIPFRMPKSAFADLDFNRM